MGHCDVWQYGSKKLALCILHCAMRSMESTLKCILQPILAKYKNGSAAEHKAIDEHLNEVAENLKIKKLAQLDQDGELVKLDLNGSEIRLLIAAPKAGEKSTLGKLLDAVCKTRTMLKLDQGAMPRWRECLGHWAAAMRSGYELKATDADRQTFRENVRWYVLKKVLINDESLCWYDWQLYSVFTKLFDAFGSLRLICQEGMEAQQKLNNDLQRRSNNGANAGRIKKSVIARGEAAIAEYLAERKKKCKSPARWIWEMMLLSFMATFQDAFERFETCKEKGRVVDWATEFVPAWATFKFLMNQRVKRVARVRRALDAKHQPDADKRYYKLLRDEYLAYYSSVPCEDDEYFPDLRPEDRLKKVRKERRERWMTNGPSLLYAPIYEGQGPMRGSKGGFCERA